MCSYHKILDLPQEQVTQYRLEYWRLQNQNKLESLYIVTKSKVSSLWKLYKELVIERGMSIEAVAKVVDIDLNRLPEMEMILEQTYKTVARKQVKVDILEARIRSLEEEGKRRRNRIVTLPPSCYYVENSAPNALPYYSASGQPPSLPYPTSGYPDLTNDFRDALKKSKEKKRNSCDV